MSAKKRLYDVLIEQKLALNRSQVETLVKLAKVRVNKEIVTSPNLLIGPADTIAVVGKSYVSRAAYKLESVVSSLGIDFKGKAVLDVGSSTGGFTDYALQHGAELVIAVDVGTDQMAPSLRYDKRIELYEKTDIRELKKLSHPVDIILIDVSFISLRLVLPTVARLSEGVEVLAMVKPQFEAGLSGRLNKGIVKNDRMRRDILKEFELWLSHKSGFRILGQADSLVSGSKGNVERFYLLKLAQDKR